MNLAAVEKIKQKNITELHYCTGMSQREIKLEKKSLLFYFFQFSNNWVRRVGKTKNKKKSGLMSLHCLSENLLILSFRTDRFEQTVQI